MSPWDSDKSTAADPDNPTADEQLTADEWDAHVNEGHFPADELNLGVDNGDPVLTDPQNADEVVLRYDRASGSWVLDSIQTGDLVIGGTLYIEDKNSPHTVSSVSSTTYTVSGTYDEIVVLQNPANVGFNQIQVNGDTGPNYSYVDNSDTQTTGETEFAIPYGSWRRLLQIRNVEGNAAIRFAAVLSDKSTGQGVGGRNDEIGGSISQFTLKDSGGSNRSTTIRVYGRSI